MTDKNDEEKTPIPVTVCHEEKDELSPEAS